MDSEAEKQPNRESRYDRQICLLVGSAEDNRSEKHPRHTHTEQSKKGEQDDRNRNAEIGIDTEPFS